jgi:hypothetical protein
VTAPGNVPTRPARSLHSKRTQEPDAVVERLAALSHELDLPREQTRGQHRHRRSCCHGQVVIGCVRHATSLCQYAMDLNATAVKRAGRPESESTRHVALASPGTVFRSKGCNALAPRCRDCLIKEPKRIEVRLLRSIPIVWLKPRRVGRPPDGHCGRSEWPAMKTRSVLFLTLRRLVARGWLHREPSTLRNGSRAEADCEAVHSSGRKLQ